MWDKARFIATLGPVIDAAARRPWDDALAAWLTETFPPGGPVFERIREAVADGVERGWMGLQGDDNRKGARVVEPTPDTRGYSVDVVEIADIVGPHHSHPRGELCAVIAVTPGARFDGNPEGWAVYPPGSAHYPSAEGGRLQVMFLLPGGEIAYTEDTASLQSGSR